MDMPSIPPNPHYSPAGGVPAWRLKALNTKTLSLASLLEPRHLCWLLAGVFLFLNSDHLLRQFGLAWKMSYVLSVALLFSLRCFWRNLLNRHTVFLLLSLFVFVLYSMARHGDGMGWRLYRLASAVPLFYIGYEVAQQRRWRLLPVAMIAGMALTCVLEVKPIVTGATTGVSREQVLLASNPFVAEQVDYDVELLKGVGVSQNASLALLLILCSGFLGTGKPWRNLGVLAVCGLMGLCVFFSGFTTPIVLICAGIAVTMFLRLHSARNLGKNWSFLVFAAVAGAALVAITHFAEEGGTVGLVGQRISQLANGGLEVDRFDVVSGGRIERLGAAFAAFFKHPFIGIGPQEGDSGYYGGHNSVADAYVWYGSLGAIPLTMTFVVWLVAAWRNHRTEPRSEMDTALFVFMLVYGIGLFLNPYFGYPMDYFVFAAAGLACGRSLRVRPGRGPNHLLNARRSAGNGWQQRFGENSGRCGYDGVHRRAR